MSTFDKVAITIQILCLAYQIWVLRQLKIDSPNIGESKNGNIAFGPKSRPVTPPPTNKNKQ